MAEDKPLSSDELALKRTIMAADRTLMAWMRTSVSLISLGFTIYKFLQYVREEGERSRIRLEGPRHLGMVMIGLGVTFLLLASIQFWGEVRRLAPHRRLGSVRLSLFLSLLLVLLGLLAMANIAFRVGPF